MSKPKILHYYIDDSGTRKPDRHPETSTDPSWFSMGGLLIWDSDKEALERSHEQFFQKWEIDEPLHSVDIRHRKGQFSWLADGEKHRIEQFYGDLDAMILEAPIFVHGCVIDRPGYWNRYHEKYGSSRWSLCKTAFSVAIERAAKIAQCEGALLKVHVERCSKKVDKRIRGYFQDMKLNGMPFNSKTSSIYKPLAQEELRALLDDIDFKTKENVIMQLADVVLFPICKVAYSPGYMPFEKLHDAGKLADVHYSDQMKIKYSCFD
jgi:hypothetical protein